MKIPIDRMENEPATSRLVQQVTERGTQYYDWSLKNRLTGFILCSWDRASQFYVNKYPTRCDYIQFILSANCSTCFGWFLHPSSGAQTTVFTFVATCR